MRIHLHEITDLEKNLNFNESDPWLLKAVTSVDEKISFSQEESSNKGKDKLQGLDSTGPSKSDLGKQEARKITTQVSLRKVDEVVVISGQIETYVDLLCSRCAAQFSFYCRPNFSGLFCKDPVMAGVAHLSHQKTHLKSGATTTTARPQGQNSGFARHAHNFEEDEAVTSGKDLDITYLSHDYIELTDVITEQLQLQVPFQPLCRDDCKGMCSHCGADLNQGRCACSKIKAHQAFSVLSDLKLS